MERQPGQWLPSQVDRIVSGSDQEDISRKNAQCPQPEKIPRLEALAKGEEEANYQTLKPGDVNCI